MNDDKADLLTRLRKVEPDKPGERTRWYRNPDGPEAADEIERLRRPATWQEEQAAVEAAFERSGVERTWPADEPDQIIPMVRAMADEIGRLREAIRRLADQDATLSVCDGAVTVQMDVALTDEEREAVAWAAWEGPVRSQADGADERAATLRGLLERAAKPDTTQTRNGTPSQGSVPERDTIADETPASTERD